MREKQNERFFELLPEIAPPTGLHGAILARIERVQKRSARLWFAGMSVIAASSFAVLVPAFRYTAEEGYRSGSYHYLSLLFSDSSAAFLYWREFMLVIAESLPLVETSVFLGMLFVSLASFRLAAKNMPAAFLPAPYGFR